MHLAAELLADDRCAGDRLHPAVDHDPSADCEIQQLKEQDRSIRELNQTWKHIFIFIRTHIAPGASYTLFIVLLCLWSKYYLANSFIIFLLRVRLLTIM